MTEPEGLPRPALDRAAAAAAAARFATLAEPDVAYAVVDSPVGDLVVAATRRGLVRLAFEDHGGVDRVVEGLAGVLSPRILEAPARLDPIRLELDEYFAGRRDRFDLPVDWSLYSDWGRRILGATARIPFGQTATYGQVAAQAGNPKAARAAGRALNTNPIAIVVPCHRVVGSGGALVGYGGGLERKVALLQLEGAQL